jgi:hypothetical protein
MSVGLAGRNRSNPCAIRQLINSNNEAKVQIEKKPSMSIFPVPPLTGHEFPVAQQHLADLPTRLALMRWTRGGDIPHPPAPPREMWRRATWYGSLQNEFQAWLTAGGFHAADLDDDEDGDAPLRLFGPENGEPARNARVTAINTTARRQALYK